MCYLYEKENQSFLPHTVTMGQKQQVDKCIDPGPRKETKILALCLQYFSHQIVFSPEKKSSAPSTAVL